MTEPLSVLEAYRWGVTRARQETQTAASGRPAWLNNAPAELKPILEIGYDKYGDDPPAIAEWLQRVRNYKGFWDIVEAQADDVLARIDRDEVLQARLAHARAHPENRLARPNRRTR